MKILNYAINFIQIIFIHTLPLEFNIPTIDGAVPTKALLVNFKAEFHHYKSTYTILPCFQIFPFCTFSVRRRSGARAFSQVKIEREINKNKPNSQNRRRRVSVSACVSVLRCGIACIFVVFFLLSSARWLWHFF